MYRALNLAYSRSLPHAATTRSLCSHTDFGRVVKNVGDVNGLITSHLERSAVVLYMKGTPTQPQCGFSWKAIQALEHVKAKYEAHDVLANPALREGIKSYAQWPTIPQLYIQGELVGGSDIMIDMARNGDLKKAVADADALRDDTQPEEKE